jgi:hypothetical protein
LNLSARPLKQKFLTQDLSTPVPETMPMVLAIFKILEVFARVSFVLCHQIRLKLQPT